MLRMAPHRFRYFLAAAGFTFLAATVLASPAPNPNSLLFFQPVSGAEKTIAASAGFTVVELDSSAWSALTTADVASYKAVVLGDQFCNFASPAVLAPVEANRAVWSAAISGNIIAIGTDPSYHSGIAGAVTLMDRALRFAAAREGKTGLYASLSCYYVGATETDVTWLDQFGGEFRVRGTPQCYDEAHIVARHPALETLTDVDLSGWGCSVHEFITKYPPGFAALAIARGSEGVGVESFADGETGVPYIVARGVEVDKCGNGKVDAGEECDDGNRENGDGCSSTCRKEVSPKTCELCIPVPGRNKCHVSSSCSPTPYGTMCTCAAGYKASKGNSNQWRVKWAVAGQDHRVYVTPGTECYELCDQWYLGPKGCAEVPVAECKL